MDAYDLLRSLELDGLDLEPWRADAACRGRSDLNWFPTKYHQIDPATRALCRTCPVADDCLDFAMRYDAAGVWGGTSRKERKALRRQRNAENRSTEPVNIKYEIVSLGYGDGAAIEASATDAQAAHAAALDAEIELLILDHEHDDEDDDV